MRLTAFYFQVSLMLFHPPVEYLSRGFIPILHVLKLSFWKSPTYVDT